MLLKEPVNSKKEQSLPTILQSVRPPHAGAVFRKCSFFHEIVGKNWGRKLRKSTMDPGDFL